MKTTGVSSTSFRIWLATFLPAVGAAVTGFVQNAGGSKSAVLGGAGIVAALISTVSKLAHDQGLNKVSIAAAGSDIAAQLPALKADLGTAVSFVENDLPGVKNLFGGINTRVTELEARIPDLAGVETLVRTVVGQQFAAASHVPAPPVIPAPEAAPATAAPAA